MGDRVRGSTSHETKNISDCAALDAITYSEEVPFLEEKLYYERQVRKLVQATLRPRFVRQN